MQQPIRGDERDDSSYLIAHPIPNSESWTTTIMFYTVEFGDTKFSVPSRYLDLAPKGVGAQGMVWWVKKEDFSTKTAWTEIETKLLSILSGIVISLNYFLWIYWNLLIIGI